MNATLLLVTSAWFAGADGAQAAGPAPQAPQAPGHQAPAPAAVPVYSAPASCSGGGCGYSSGCCGQAYSCCDSGCGSGKRSWGGLFSGWGRKSSSSCCDTCYTASSCCDSGCSKPSGCVYSSSCGCDSGCGHASSCCDSGCGSSRKGWQWGGLFSGWGRKKGGDCCESSCCDSGCGSSYGAPVYGAPAYGAPVYHGAPGHQAPGAQAPGGKAPEPIKMPKEGDPGKKLPGGEAPKTGAVSGQGAVIAPTAGSQPAVEIKNPFEISRRYETRVDHAADYSNLTGQLFFVHADGGQWVLRYAPLGKEDPYGGSVVLARDLRMDSYREGDLVTVRGEIIRPKSSMFLGGPLYRATSIQLIDRPAQN